MRLSKAKESACPTPNPGCVAHIPDPPNKRGPATTSASRSCLEGQRSVCVQKSGCRALARARWLDLVPENRQLDGVLPQQ